MEEVVEDKAKEIREYWQKKVLSNGQSLTEKDLDEMYEQILDALEDAWGQGMYDGSWNY